MSCFNALSAWRFSSVSVNREAKGDVRMKRVLAVLAVAGAQPLLAYSDPTPEVPTCVAPPAASHPRAEAGPSVASDKVSKDPAARSMLAAGLVTAAAPPAANARVRKTVRDAGRDALDTAEAPADARGTPAAQAPASSSRQGNFNSMSKSIIQNIRARGSNPSSGPVSPAPGDDPADSQATGSAARLNSRPQETVVVPVSSGRGRTAVTCTGTAVAPTEAR
jgi:hypothetical protein